MTTGGGGRRGLCTLARGPALAPLGGVEETFAAGYAVPATDRLGLGPRGGEVERRIHDGVGISR